MKKRVIFLFLLAVSLITGVEAHAKLNLNEMDYLNKVEILNSRLKRDLVIDTKSRSGDLNYEFLKLVQAHQRIMVEFAQNEVQYGEDENIREVARDIIKEKRSVLDKIEKAIKNIENNLVVDKVKESAYFASYDEIYQRLLERIKTGSETESFIVSKGVDRDFLGSMVVQYEVMSEMTGQIWTFTNSKMIGDLVEDMSQTSQTRLESLYEMVKQIDEKKDDSK